MTPKTPPTKFTEEAIKRGHDMRVIGVPKTIDNDLPHTDHCPGYGSVIKYNATTVMEVAFDVSSMATDDGSCCLIEVMGAAPLVGLLPAPCWPSCSGSGCSPHYFAAGNSPGRSGISRQGQGNGCHP